MKLRRKSQIYWVIAIILITVLFFYYPNIFLSGKILYKIGLYKYKQGDHGDYNDWNKVESAAFYFEKAIGSGYKKRDVYEYLTNCYWILGNKVMADSVYSLAIIQYPNDVIFYFYQGGCRKELKNIRGALRDFDEVIKLDNTYKNIANAYYDRGAMRYVLGDTIGAKADRLQVKKLVGEDWGTYEDYCRTLGLDKNEQ